MEILVITGGIGSGKSEVCRILARKGLNAQYNADAKVKDIALALNNVINDYAEIEVVEYHHSKKADSPSGTAKAIIEKIREAQPNLTALPRTKKREQNEIGVSCVRCGTIVGRHDVIFGLDNETITLSHSAQSREIFSVGAINLARWLKGKPCGLYSMQDFLYKQFNGGFKQEI